VDALEHEGVIRRNRGRKIKGGKTLGSQNYRKHVKRNFADHDDPDHKNPWKIAESIAEAMTDQPSRDSVFLPEQDKFVHVSIKLRRTLLTTRYRDPDPNRRIPLPEYAVRIFNKAARNNPICLQVKVENSPKGLKVDATQ